MIVYDPNKNQRNIELRCLSFDLVNDFDWESALIKLDARHDYSEDRYQAIGSIFDLLYVVVFTLRDENIRVISLRRANKREQKRYVER